MDPDRPGILTVNAGSSSLKFALFDGARPPVRRFHGRIERIGLPDTKLSVTEADGTVLDRRQLACEDLAAAADVVIDWLTSRPGPQAIAAVGHRVVHGGGRFDRPEIVSAGMIDELRRISSWDPDHMPGALALIEAFQRHDPGLLQVACFDTAFHHTLPRVAQIVPIPRRLESKGVRRYGFHGLSYTYLMEELARVAGPEAAGGRIVLAHLGAGASLAAVREGRSIETSMGFTPASGVVMATRTGDLDQGLVEFLARTEGMSAGAFQEMVNQQSGLLGVSETSPDLRDLLARESEDIRAAEAVALFCYRVKLTIGAFAAALGGLDTLVFSGGIGENSDVARHRICGGLEFLGLRLDEALNAESAPVISVEGSQTVVRVIRTDEESIIARSVARLIQDNATDRGEGLNRHESRGT